MKKSVRIFLCVFAIILSIFIGFCFYYLAVTKGVKIDEKKLINVDNSAIYYDYNGEKIAEVSSFKTVVSGELIPDNLKNAFVAIEDKRFYSHNGIDYKGLIRATLKNIASFSFKQGASTITQQLVKNTHLTSEKTFNRKLKEIKLAKEIEKNYSKNEILEKYLNTIYFGDGSYGISNASKRFFNKNVDQLSLSECAVLAGIVKSPYTYSPIYNKENCIKRRNLVLSEMKNQGYISESEYANSIKSKLTINQFYGDKFDYLYLAKKEVAEILKNSPYSQQNLKVYTYYNSQKQDILSKEINENNTKTDKSGIILDKNNKVLAYSSTAGNINRQLGSTIKPILVYAPAIEENHILPITPILDEKINYSGYSPKNFNNTYLGYVSAEYALSHSINTCAVKILNSIGVDKAFKYIEKLNINYEQDDKNLSSALGSLKNGENLTKITASYSVFRENGEFSNAKCIKKIIYNGKVIYADNNKKTKVFSNETAFLTDEMLKTTVKSGTAKKLNTLNFNIRAKTGTAGNKNGNTDAYTISYNGDYSIGVWVGNKDNSLMDNSITGANKPLEICYNVWDNIYKNEIYIKQEREIPLGVSKIYLDKISYEKNNKIVLAENIAPSEYKMSAYFKNNNMPKETSTRFSTPKIESKELLVNNNEIELRLCVAQYYDYKVFKEINGVKLCIYDSKINNGIIKDTLSNATYSVIPYYTAKDKIIYGKEEFFNKIKSPTDYVGDDWIILKDL